MLARILLILSVLAGPALGQSSPRQYGDAAAAVATFNPRQFGAHGDGLSHPAGAALGIETLAQLCAASVNSQHPFGFLCSGYPFGRIVNLFPAAAVSPGNTAIPTSVTRATAAVSPSFGAAFKSGQTRAGQTAITVAYVAGLDRILPGTGVSGPGLASGTTAQSALCTVGAANTCQVSGLSAATTTALDPANRLSIAASWAVFLADTAAVEQGMAVTGANIQAGTFVDLVNHGTGEVRLSKITTGLVPSGTRLTFAWDLSGISPGMTVLGAGIPAGTTVDTIEASSITLSAPSIAALAVATDVSASNPVADGTMLTLFRPYTDAEAKALEMDGIAINAAIRAAQARTNGAANQQVCGGDVRLPAGNYLSDQPIILPLHYQYATAPFCGVDLVGAGRATTSIQATHDFGLRLPLISTGDPAAHVSNKRGVYAGTGNNFSEGHLDGLSIQPAYALIPVATQYGLRPTWARAPVKMTGILQGARRHMRDVRVTGFNVGIEFENEDHTRWEHVAIEHNFLGFRIGPGTTDLFGDDHWMGAEFRDNAWANISVASTGYLDGSFSGETHVAYAPYSIWCEAGPGSTICIGKVTIAGKANLEAQGCGFVKEAGMAADGTGGGRYIDSLTIAGAYAAPDYAYQPVGGCASWAYFDIYAIASLSLLDVSQGTWLAPAVAGQPTGPLLKTQRVAQNGGYGGPNTGSVLVQGSSVSLLLQQYGGVSQPVVYGYGGTGSSFFGEGDYHKVRFRTPGLGLDAKLLPVIGSAALPIGTLLEYAVQNGQLQAQAAGTAPTSLGFAGVNLQPWNVAPSASSGFYTVVQTAGTQTPVRVSAPAAVGTVLQVPAGSSAAPGVAVTSGGSSTLGIVSNANGGSASLVYVQTLSDPGLAAPFTQRDPVKP